MKWKPLLKNWAPPCLWNLAAKFFKRGILFQGEYSSWQEAQNHSIGYAADAILEKVRKATREATATGSAQERDGALLENLSAPYPLLTVLYASVLRQHRLHVLDFGGALGGTYHRCRRFFSETPDFTWSVVEQPAFAECGAKEFEDGALRFYATLDQWASREIPQVLLLSGVLSYLENPYQILTELARHPFDTVLIDRTPFSSEDRDTLVVQENHGQIPFSSYPCWIFSKHKILNLFLHQFQIISEHVNDDRVISTHPLQFQGLILQRRKQLVPS
jgi:putative methyltransferase (TIGR04325 family)